MRAHVFLLGVLLAICAAGSADAHELRPAYLELTEVEQANVRYKVLWKQPVLQNEPLAVMPEFSGACPLTELSHPEVTSAAILHQWQSECDLSRASLHIDGLSATHTDVLVRWERLSGETSSFVLRPGNPRLNLAKPGAPALQYFVIGVEHLVFGVDHVLFVIGLFLFIRAPIPLIKTITAFTVAHSITLALSVLEVVKLDQGSTEVVIALSILFLARELVRDDTHRSRLTMSRPWLMAFIFGLLHGLGFAGALADIGLPEDDLALSLLLFNVGIEVGQIAVILLLAAIAWALSRWNWERRFSMTAAWGMGCAAAYWSIDRTAALVL